MVLAAAFQETFRELAMFFHVRDHLGCLRKSWAPQGGAGSQDDGHDSHKALLEVMRNVITDRELGDDNESFLAAFFGAFKPPKVYQVGTEERVKFVDVKDTDGDAFLVDAGAVGDGDGYGSLFVVAYVQAGYARYFYYVVTEEGVVENFSHHLPLAGYEAGAMYEIPPDRWPMR